MLSPPRKWSSAAMVLFEAHRATAWQGSAGLLWHHWHDSASHSSPRKTVVIKGPSDAARTPGKYMMFQSGVVQPNTHSFHIHQAFLDGRMTLQCTDSISTKPERLSKLSALTVKISTLRNGCDKIFTPSGRLLPQEFDVTDCAVSKCARVLSGAGSVKSTTGTQTLAVRGQTCSLLLTSATPSKTSPPVDQKQRLPSLRINWCTFEALNDEEGQQQEAQVAEYICNSDFF